MDQNNPESLHLKEHIRPILKLNPEERVNALYQDRWIGYDRAVKIMKLLDDILKQPIRIRPQCLLIVGEPNIGKTTIAIEFVKKHQCHTEEGTDTEGQQVSKPVINAIAPSTADEKALYIALIDRFFSPFRPTDSKSKLRHQLITLLREFKTRMIVIDEIHNLLSGTASKQREVMNALKNLSNELNISLVGVGTSEAVQVLHTDSQHASRFDVVELPKWDLDRKFLQLLASYEQILPLRKHSKLSSKEMAPLLFNISEGNFGDLNRLLIECTKEAINTGTEEITLEIITKFKTLKPTKGHRKIRSLSL